MNTYKPLCKGMTAAILAASIPTLVNAEDVGGFTAWLASSFGNNNGWTTENHPRVMADMNGDGLADIVGFANKGVYVALSTGSKFLPMTKWSSGFTLKDGQYYGDKHPRYVVDIDNNGCADIVGFGNDSVAVATFYDSDNDGFCDAGGKLLNFFQGFGALEDPDAPRFVADINGDNCGDLMYFGRTEVEAAVGHCDGTFTKELVGLGSYRSASLQPGELAWDFSVHKVLMGDIDGDGNDDIIGFHDAGVFVSQSNGDGTFKTLTPYAEPDLASFGTDDGWSIVDNGRQLVDMNADGMLDILGFANTVTVVSYANGTGFNPYVIISQEFGKKKGWGTDTIRTTGHINDDGCPDLIGFGNGGVQVSVTDPLYDGDCSSDSVKYQPSQLAVTYYSNDRGGWNNTDHVRHVADLNGDGLTDVVGFASSSVYASLTGEITTKKGMGGSNDFIETVTHKVMR